MILSRKSFFGYVVLAIDIVSWAIAAAASQALQRNVPDFQLSALRYIGCMVVSIIWIYFKKPSTDLLKIHYVYIIVMSVASVFYNTCFFSAVSLLPLTDAAAFTIGFKTIIFTLMTTIKSQIPIDKILIISIVGCIGGTICITQPWSGFAGGFTPEFLESMTTSDETMQFNLSMLNYNNVSSFLEPITNSDEKMVYHAFLLGLLLSLLAAVADGVYFLVVSVNLKSVDPAVQSFASALVCFPISVIISFYVEQPIIISGTLDILLVSTHVLATGICLLTLTAALQLLNPIKVAIIQNVDTVINIIPQYVFMGRHLYGRKNILEVFGCILIALFAGLSPFSYSSHYHEDLS